MRKIASLASIVVGAIMVVAGVLTWVVVTNTLDSQNITVADDADCRAGASVTDPWAAYCQAEVIDKHTLDATGGKTYAELDREDPLRETAMTSAFLQSSLFTSVVAYGVAAMATVLGILLVLIGFGLRDVPTRARDDAGATAANV